MKTFFAQDSKGDRTKGSFIHCLNWGKTRISKRPDSFVHIAKARPGDKKARIIGELDRNEWKPVSFGNSLDLKKF